MVTLGHVIPPPPHTHKKKIIWTSHSHFLFCHQVAEFRHKQNPASIGLVKKSPIDRSPEKAGVFLY
jgi:hypothetical protein